jgi:hypothetical protein
VTRPIRFFSDLDLDAVKADADVEDEDEVGLLGRGKRTWGVEV